MKILEINVHGLPLFEDPLTISFYAKQRVREEDKSSLQQIWDRQSVFLHPATVFIGVNASGKTSILKVIRLAFGIVGNEPINHIPEKTILGNSEKTIFRIVFVDARKQVCCLESEIRSKKTKSGERIYFMERETLWKKTEKRIKSKKAVVDFSAVSPASVRNKDEAFLPDDVSFIIAHNKKYQDCANVCSLLAYTNINVLPVSEETISPEMIAFLDPSIESLYFQRMPQGDMRIHLKFRKEPGIVICDAKDLDKYLSSGTIKGIIAFSMVKDVLKSGGYLLIDEIENHFNQEIVNVLIQLFSDSGYNRNGGTLVFTTHYPTVLDLFDRNDNIFFVRNLNGISATNLSDLLRRNDIKKSEVYQSGLFEGTAPAYESYLQLRKALLAFVG